ncbi:hypothetical protein Pse7367_2402 [Thalassoporum mexicanum PCC 7367]|uniref:DUF3067 family protein n=1 Tax=Thalassoporum mexicanum TaxID=3457544 RepID=UPI00029F8386|nr:DUF3067 family protein [Pseudanabaena sp. PCC 7367]AFY70663.1 hypothetical protein Pse7367_2402 [Pseudanabaena sp. PCC 7367]
MTGAELRQIIVAKWGFSYDIQLRRLKDRIIAQVMWRYLEQASFPLSEAEYLDRLGVVATYFSDWGVTEQVKEFIQTTKSKPRLGKAVNIPLAIGDRSLEWLLDQA